MKNKLGEEAKFNILIRTKPEKVEHKMEDVINAKNEKCNSEEDMDSGWCWWDVSRAPIREGILKVLFTDGKNVFAEGDFYGTSTDPAIEFSPLRRVNYPQPREAPTRGFTYVEIKK